jgi:hypothetical protein
MNKRAGVALMAVVVGAFLLANRAAYKGYFQEDEIDSLSWAPDVPVKDYVQALITPKFLENNFRPAGHFYFREAGLLFGLDYPKYVFPIHLLHFLNVWLVWLAVRRLGAGVFASSVAALFFAFHMAVFDVYWKPMYVFDELCATFCLLSFLAWLHGRWVLSFLAFWLAYKSKELAVMLPAVLLCYEYWLGHRRWKPLVPFFLVSLSFGLQAFLWNSKQEHNYTFLFTPAALLRTSSFYAGKIFLLPFAGYLLLLLPVFIRHRRAWFGLAATLLFFFPLLFLPGRVFSAYCYVPLIGLAIAVSAVAELGNVKVVSALLLIWIAGNEMVLRRDRSHKLFVDAENRAYMNTLAGFSKVAPEARNFVWNGSPSEFRYFGIFASIRYFWRRTDFQLTYVDDKDAAAALARPEVSVLDWDPSLRALRITLRREGQPDAVFPPARASSRDAIRAGYYRDPGRQSLAQAH